MFTTDPKALALMSARLGYSQESIAGFLTEKHGVPQRQARQMADESLKQAAVIEAKDAETVAADRRAIATEICLTRNRR